MLLRLQSKFCLPALKSGSLCLGLALALSCVPAWAEPAPGDERAPVAPPARSVPPAEKTLSMGELDDGAAAPAVLEDSKPAQAERPAEADPGVKESKAVVHYTLANFYVRRWNLDLAETELDVAISYWPDFKAAHRDMCIVALCQGNIFRSLAELMMVTGLGEPIPYTASEREDLRQRALKAHYKKGCDWVRRHTWKDARAEFEWALVYGPDDPVVHRSLAFVYANMGDFDRAEKQYEKTFALDPSDAFAHADFASMLADTGQPGRAEAQLSQAVRLAPTAAALHVDLGWMAESKGNLDTAGAEFRKAADLSPGHAWIWAHLGKLFEKQGRADEAIKAYDRALSLDPAQNEVKERLAKLRGNEAS